MPPIILGLRDGEEVGEAMIFFEKYFVAQSFKMLLDSFKFLIIWNPLKTF